MKFSNIGGIKEWEVYMVILNNLPTKEVLYIVRGGFEYFSFSALRGEDSHFDQYVSKGLKPPTSIGLVHFYLCIYIYIFILDIIEKMVVPLGWCR